MKLHVSGVGRLSKDPEIKKTKNDKDIAFFTVVTNDSSTKEAQFISCRAFGQTAIFIRDHFYKGKPIHITGKWGQYQGPDNSGNTKPYDYCEITSVDFVPSDSKKE